MKSGLSIGNRGELQWTVGAEHSIHLGATTSGGAVVFATPAMVALMEYAARETLAPFLEPGEESVGVEISVEHLAATPIAARVRAEATVLAIDGRQIDFEVAAYDDLELIGRGRHRRAIVRIDRFNQRLAEKIPKLSSGVLLPMAIEPNSGDLPKLETLRIEVTGGIAKVTLNRPRQLNAVNVEMTSDWEQIIAWLAGHADTVRVVIVTGEGDTFCAGDDVKEVGTLAISDAQQLSLRQARMYLAFETLPQVFIAAVNGYALGGGCVCAYSCDFRIAAHNARFGMPEIALGWPPGYGVAQLTALVGKARALDLCLTARQISAQEALEMGLVHQVVPVSRLAAAAYLLAEKLLSQPPVALRETKWLVHADEGSQPKITHLADTAAYIRSLQTADAREGIAAFSEKRQAKFTGK
jgi:enoyl-CoA hydratase